MSVLEIVEMENVQVHKSTVFEFHPHLNVIVGTSDNGKSTVIRGADWTVNNEAQYDFMNWDAERGEACTYAMQFEDGFVLRSRSKSKNFYQTHLDDTPLEAFGKRVPNDVQQTTRMSALNIKSQDDPYFLFGKSPGEVARMLNKAVGNEDIDIYFKRVDNIISTSNKRVKFLTTQIEKEQAKEAALSWLDAANKEVARIDKLSTKYKVRREQFNILCKIINDLSNDAQSRSMLVAWLKVEEPFLKVKALHEKFLQKQKRVESLSGIIDTCYDLIETKKLKAGWLEIEAPVKKLITLSKKIDNQKQRVVRLQNTINTINSLIQKQKVARMKAEKAKKQHDSMLIELKICPTCGQSTEDI